MIKGSQIGLLTALSVAIAGCGVRTTTSTLGGHAKGTSATRTAAKIMRWNAPPSMALNVHDNYQATVKTTAGSFVIQLFSHRDPVAVNNFVFLAHHQFFNGNQFFRVITPFIIQTGDPLNKGTGGPGYTWNAELPPPVPYQPGIVAMAVNNTSVNSNGSQFFICTGPQSEQLNQSPQYTELGRVIKGWTSVQKIAHGAVTTNPGTGEDSLPLHPYSMISVSIQTTPASGAKS